MKNSGNGPSTVDNVFWLRAERKKGDYPARTVRSGKWLVFVDAQEIDAVWGRVKSATVKGRLGFASKVATARPNPNAENPNKRVICIYTYDWTDRNDVLRIRNELRQLDITNKIPYKTDEATNRGEYRVRGDQNISKYYE